MAVTKIINIKKTPKKSLEYIMNPEKALHVSGLNCVAPNPSIAHKQFDEVREYYGKNNKNLQYHLIQSFVKDDANIIPDLVHKIGVKTAEELFCKYQVVISTHTDKDHIHNHIMINAVSYLDGLKYNDCDSTYAMIRKSSDHICKEHGLDILEHTTEYSRYENNIKRPVKETDSYYDTSDYRNSQAYENAWEDSQSFSSRIRNDIDKAILECVDFDKFILLMRSKGYEIKFGNVKHIAFKSPEQQRFKRGYTLGENYTEEAIKHRINENHKSKEKELLSIKDNEETSSNPTSHNQAQDDVRSSLQPGKKKRKYRYENYRYGITNIDKLDEIYKRIIYNDGIVKRIPRPQIETIFIRDLKETEVQRKKLWSMLNQKSSSYIIKVNKVKEKELIDRINNNFKQLKFIERNEISGFDDINKNITSLKKQHQEISDNLTAIDSRIKSMEKMYDIILKYQIMVERKPNADNADELKLLQDCEIFLISKNLSTQKEQAAFISRLDEFRKNHSTIKNMGAKVTKKMKEYDMLIMTLQYIDKHGRNLNTNNFNQYYTIRSNNVQKE